MKQVRPEPEYFRVGFYGKGFPSSVRVRPLAKRIIWRISNEFALFHLAWRSFRCLSQCIVRGTTGTWWMFVTYFWCVVWLDQSNYKLGRARGSHDNIRWREMSTPPSRGFDWSVQTDPIRTFVKTLSTNGNGSCGNASSCATIKSTLPFINTYILTWFRCP